MPSTFLASRVCRSSMTGTHGEDGAGVPALTGPLDGPGQPPEPLGPAEEDGRCRGGPGKGCLRRGRRPERRRRRV
eukprot:6874548-Pyramimonas_sp.AAC.1